MCIVPPQQLLMFSGLPYQLGIFLSLPLILQVCFMSLAEGFSRAALLQKCFLSRLICSRTDAKLGATVPQHLGRRVSLKSAILSWMIHAFSSHAFPLLLARSLPGCRHRSICSGFSPSGEVHNCMCAITRLELQKRSRKPARSLHRQILPLASSSCTAAIPMKGPSGAGFPCDVISQLALEKRRVSLKKSTIPVVSKQALPIGKPRTRLALAKHERLKCRKWVVDHSDVTQLVVLFLLPWVIVNSE